MKKWRFLTPALLCALLAACGGGGGDSSNSGPVITPPTQEPGAPTLTGNTATDGYNWINYRRAQVGLSTLARNSRIDVAAQGHSDYQRLNRTITHEQTDGLPGFTGVTLKSRLLAAGYPLGLSFTAGEVISATTSGSGFFQAEELITAVYHRFVIFEPVFTEIGTGAASITGSYTYFTADFAALGTPSGLGTGRLAIYPVANQSGVALNFFSDSEAPDPVPDRNEVGYPISVHADYGSTVLVRSFTVTPRGGTALATRLLSFAGGTSNNSSSAAAIVPLAPLRSATTYDVSFSGTVGGVDVSRSWSFSTK